MMLGAVDTLAEWQRRECGGYGVYEYLCHLVLILQSCTYFSIHQPYPNESCIAGL